MKIKVKFTPYMRVLTETDQIVIDLDESAHLSDLLKVLTTRYGEGLIDLLYTSELGPIDTWPSAIVDGQAVPLTPKSDVKLKEGSVVVLLAAAGGG